MFSQIADAINHYMPHFSGLREHYASKVPSQQNSTKITPTIEFYSVMNKQQSSYLTIVLITYIAAFRYIWQFRNIGKKITFSFWSSGSF